MRNGTCQKCGGDEVYAAASGLPIGGGAQAAINAHIEPGFRGIRSRHMTEGLWTFLCAGCGSVEIYLLDAAAIDFVRQNWVRVPAAE